MLYIHRIKEQERGLLYRDGDFVGLLPPGRHVTWSLARLRVQAVSLRHAQLEHEDLDVILQKLGEHPELRVIELRDDERALVWIDGRFHAVHGPGRYAYWLVDRQVEVQVVTAEAPRFEHAQLANILRHVSARSVLEALAVEAGHVGLFYVDGALHEVLQPGSYAAWKQAGRYKLVTVQTLEQGLDIDGQEIMTADKVSLRVNAHLVYRVVDPVAAAETVGDVASAIYRAAQLSLRAVIATRELDALLAERDAVAADLGQLTRDRVSAFGVAVVAVGLRDVILPGEMKTILNRVTEARKAAEASLITRREEVAAARSQANTAKILAENPVLMRLRELEVLQSIAEHNKLSIRLSDKGLTDTLTKLV